MPDAFTVLWTHYTCRALRSAGLVGERPTAAFGGVHQSLPAWSGARVGDEVYALHAKQRQLFVVSRMRIVDLERRECCDDASSRWRTGFPGHADWAMLGAGDCGAEVVHVDATPVRFDRRIPGELLERLTWRNGRGRTRVLKYVVDGMLERAVSLQGFYRLTADSADELAAIVDGPDDPDGPDEPDGPDGSGEPAA